MRLSCLRCSLIILLLSAQADDTWLATAWPTPPVADDDEYLPTEQRRAPEESEIRQTLAIAQPGSRVAGRSLNDSDTRYRSKVTDYFASLTLYVFMSLRR
jgi:hypothetical protein